MNINMNIKYQRSVHYDEQVGITNLKIFFSSRLCKDSKTRARISLQFIIYCIFYKSILCDCYFTENLSCSLQRDIIAYTFHLITRAMIQFKSLIRERYASRNFAYLSDMIRRAINHRFITQVTHVRIYLINVLEN